MYDLFIIFIIGIILIYIKLCSVTIHKTDNNNLSEIEKNISFITNALGYLLSILLITIESMYISKNYSSNMTVRIIELLIVISLVFIAYYGHIFREKENDTLCKIASGIWPLIGALGIISIICMNTIYLHYNNLSSDNYSFQNIFYQNKN